VYAFDAGRRRVIAFYPFANAFKVFYGLPSELQEVVQPFADLSMRETVAVFQSVLAAFDGFDEAVLFCEIAGNNVLHKLVWVATLLFARRVRRACSSGLKLTFTPSR
jgi:hypothetical protein